MARFELQLPEEIMNDFKKIYDNAENIFGAMTKAGAEVVMSNVKANAPKSFNGSNIMSCLKITRTYKTPSDDGINNKVIFDGYFTNKNGKKTPADLVVKITEYGSSKHKYPKHPFFRKSFRKAEIESAMLAAQKKASGGLLDNE